MVHGACGDRTYFPHGFRHFPFAVKLAKVTLMLAKEVEIREARGFGQSEDLFIEEKALPPSESARASFITTDSIAVPKS